MGRYIDTCTRDLWSCGGTSGTGIDGVRLEPFIYRPGRLFKDGQSRYQRGDWYGVCVPRDSVDIIELTHGYAQPYGRNLLGFKQSRAARKRGHVCTDTFYNMGKNLYTPEYIARRKEQVRKILEG